MARARLRDRHQHNLRRKLQLLKQEQGVQHAPGGTEQRCVPRLVALRLVPPTSAAA